MLTGTKFNTRKEDVAHETYLGLLVFRFYYRCTNCAAEFCMKTDPKVWAAAAKQWKVCEQNALADGGTWGLLQGHLGICQGSCTGNTCAYAWYRLGDRLYQTDQAARPSVQAETMDREVYTFHLPSHINRQDLKSPCPNRDWTPA